MQKITNWVGLASGTGTIFDFMFIGGLTLPKFVVVDQECEAADKAQARGIEVIMMPREGKFNVVAGCNQERRRYTLEVAELLKERGIELVVMAGWMTVFAGEMFSPKYFLGRILNTHPSLLPEFKGHQAVRDALAAKASVTGCTVHIATASLDDGPILGQREVPIETSESEDHLHERIKRQERPLYTEIVRQILAGELDLDAIWADWKARQPA